MGIRQFQKIIQVQDRSTGFRGRKGRVYANLDCGHLKRMQRSKIPKTNKTICQSCEESIIKSVKEQLGWFDDEE